VTHSFNQLPYASRFALPRIKKVFKKNLSARLGLHDVGKKIRDHDPPLSISFGEVSINQIQSLLSKPIKCINHSTRRRMFPLIQTHSEKLISSVAYPKRQKADGPQICSLYVAPGVSSFSESMNTAWKEELAQIQAELDEINAMVRLEGKAGDDAQTGKQRHEVVKAEVLLQETKEEVEIIRGQCDDLIGQHKKAMQKHEIQWQLFGEKLDQYGEGQNQLVQLVQLIRGETEEREVKEGDAG
jgi:hypothetical protein